jgi:hypothetical protein
MVNYNAKTLTWSTVLRRLSPGQLYCVLCRLSPGQLYSPGELYCVDSCFVSLQLQVNQTRSPVPHVDLRKRDARQPRMIQLHIRDTFPLYLLSPLQLSISPSFTHITIPHLCKPTPFPLSFPPLPLPRPPFPPGLIPSHP